MVMQHHKSECLEENCFTVFNVKVTVRAYIIKILLFLMYLLNCWSVCGGKKSFDGTASYVGVVCGKLDLAFRIAVNVNLDGISSAADLL